MNALNTTAPLVSVIICTRNRAGLLQQAIESVISQDFPRDDYELLVIDNASTDSTPAVVQRFEQAHVRYFHEPEIGLCVARNTGWKAARGRYVAYFDDDAIAARGWLGAVVKGFEMPGLPERIGVVGGRVDPIWEQARPEWLADEIATSLTIVDWGPNTKIIADLQREWLVGANMAVPKTLLEELGGFHPWLDRVGENLLSSGDVFLQKEIMRHGYHCVYVPEMAIRHLAAGSRLNQRWFRRRFYWQGISDAVIHLIEHSPSRVERFALAMRRAAILAAPNKLANLVFAAGEDRLRFRDTCFALIDLGFIAGMLGAAGR